MRTILFAGALLALALPALATSGRTPPAAEFDIEARWTPAQEPSAVWLQIDGERVDLVRGASSYTKRVPMDGLLGRRAFLHARYVNGDAVIPVRLIQAKPRMALTVHRSPGGVVCDFTTIRRLRQSTNEYLDQIVQYFDAKRLVREWPSYCPQAVRSDVVGAWYRNSYRLARTDHIELDEDASQQWDGVRRRVQLPKSQQRYGLTDAFEIEQFEASALLSGYDYRHQLQLIDEQAFDEALAVNEAMMDAFVADEALATAAAQAQGVTVRRLADDRAYIETLRAESSR